MTGRNTEYQPEYNLQAYEQARQGATDRQLAAFFKVSRHTIINWKKKHPEFKEQIDTGKAEADAAVIQSLYQKALGFSYTEVQVKDCESKTTKTTNHKYCLPDTAAILFWLRNRQPDEWRDKPVYAEPEEERVKQIFKIGDQEIEF